MSVGCEVSTCINYSKLAQKRHFCFFENWPTNTFSKIYDIWPKVIIHKLRCEVSQVEQDTIDNISTAYFENILIKLKKYIY